MKNYTLLYTFFICILLFNCQKQNNAITQKNDYQKYLGIKTNKNLELANSEITYWENKYKAAPNQTSYLNIIAAYYTDCFMSNFEVNNLYKTEELLLKANNLYNEKDVTTLHALAKNYITQHRFKEALVLAEKAQKIGEKRKENNLLIFDIQMELGNYKEAKKYLDLNYNINDFDYLIRAAKWNDHLGDLETAIKMMEKAAKKAELNENKTLKIWAYSNLGDMYGHAGKIKESYQKYLQTLQEDPNNYYALKGIAWIAFSYEKNTTEAKRIINSISKKHQSPDFYLFLAEIAAYENNIQEEKNQINKYFSTLKTKNFGVMYNKYNVLLYTENKVNMSKALVIAEQEIKNRPTPESYDLLAWTYFNLGNKEIALDICTKFIANKTHEPAINYHLAEIYKANNLVEKVKPIKKDLQESLFELGPNMQDQIEKL
jgi:tetratricopeptide (TPR) repeat protein